MYSVLITTKALENTWDSNRLPSYTPVSESAYQVLDVPEGVSVHTVVALLQRSLASSDRLVEYVSSWEVLYTNGQVDGNDLDSGYCEHYTFYALLRDARQSLQRFTGEVI